MKYNLIKLRDGKVIEFICKGVELSEAVNRLNECHTIQFCDAFQDVSKINWNESNLHSFVCHKNKAIIQYQIEVDFFNQLAETINPLHELKSLCKN